jgi:hypothetical protein
MQHVILFFVGLHLLSNCGRSAARYVKYCSSSSSSYWTSQFVYQCLCCLPEVSLCVLYLLNEISIFRHYIFHVHRMHS